MTTTFAYTGRDSAGKPVQGDVNASSKTEAIRMLRGEGKVIVSIEPKSRSAASKSPPTTPAATGGKVLANASARASGSPSATAARVAPREPVWPGKPAAPLAGAPVPAANMFAPAPRLNKDDVRAFAQQMAVMLETGVALSDALEACQDSKLSPGFSQALRGTLDGVRAGMSFSMALARYPRVFSPLFINMVRASEASGQLGPMLRRLADFIAGQHAMTKRIRGAIAYPMVMLALAVGVVIFLMAYVLPKFASIYAGREELLPAVTRIMMGMSDKLASYGLYAGGGAAVAGIAAFVYLRTPAGRLLVDRFRLALPLFGPLLHKTCLARSLRTLGALIQAGVSVLESVELTASAAGSATYERFWMEVQTRLQHGKQISEAVRDHRLVPRGVCKMIEAGERGGKLSETLERVASHAEEDVASDVKTVTGMVEPAIVVFLGAVVGVVVTAMLLPIFTLSKAMTPH